VASFIRSCLSIKVASSTEVQHRFGAVKDWVHNDGTNRQHRVIRQARVPAALFEVAAAAASSWWSNPTSCRGHTLTHCALPRHSHVCAVHLNLIGAAALPWLARASCARDAAATSSAAGLVRRRAPRASRARTSARTAALATRRTTRTRTAPFPSLTGHERTRALPFVSRTSMQTRSICWAMAGVLKKVISPAPAPWSEPFSRRRGVCRRFLNVLGVLCGCLHSTVHCKKVRAHTCCNPCTSLRKTVYAFTCCSSSCLFYVLCCAPCCAVLFLRRPAWSCARVRVWVWVCTCVCVCVRACAAGGVLRVRACSSTPSSDAHSETHSIC
jgi:hypothetical protein